MDFIGSILAAEIALTITYLYALRVGRPGLATPVFHAAVALFVTACVLMLARGT